MRNKQDLIPIVIKRQAPVVSERFQNIMTNLQFIKSKKNNTIKSIVVTSANKAEGKSFCIYNLAIAYAKQNKKVLIIDADFYKRKLTNSLKFRRFPGLSTILSNKEDPLSVVNETNIKNLYILPSGIEPPNTIELVNTERMQEILSYYEKEFDCILIDTPPVLLTSESRILGNICDGVILVTKSGETKKKEVLASMTALKLSNSRIIGTILNGKKFNRKEWQNYTYV